MNAPCFVRRVDGDSPTIGRRKRRPPRRWLAFQELERRALLAINIVLDYSHDTNNFFNTQAKRDLLQSVVNQVGSLLNNNLLAIVPSGSDTWQAQFTDPSTGQPQTINNMTVAANTIVIFVGGRVLPGTLEAGEGSTGGLTASGDQNWLNLVKGRGQPGALANPPTGYGPWGGAISFDTSTSFYFGQNLGGIAPNQVDFVTVAAHELGHVLGIGTANSWFTHVDRASQTFTGPNAEAITGGNPLKLDPGLQHWLEGTTINGATALMDPVIAPGTRESYTSLDYAALVDVGWVVSGPSTTPPTSTSVFQFGAPTYTISQADGTATITVTRTGGTDPVSVVFSTFAGTARPGVDFTPISIPLNFAAGQTVVNVAIPILNNPNAGAAATVGLRLNSPSGGATLGRQDTAALTIFGNGFQPGDDFNATGSTQLAVFRPSTAQWFVGGNPQPISFGAGNLFDIPVPGDYDGIGRTELAVFRTSTAQWFILNPITNTQRVVSFGAGNLFDIPAPGDYDGIGRTELAVFRPSTAQWFIGGHAQPISYGAGNLFDFPVPGNYDGVGRTELAVFRPSTAQWFIGGHAQPISFGAGNLFDFPVEASIGSLKALGRVGTITLGASRVSAAAPAVSAMARVDDIAPPVAAPGLKPTRPAGGLVDPDVVWLAALEALNAG